jgi:cytoskeletal protein RodZ
MDLESSKRIRRIISVIFLGFIAVIIIVSAYFNAHQKNKEKNLDQSVPEVIDSTSFKE